MAVCVLVCVCVCSRKAYKLLIRACVRACVRVCVSGLCACVRVSLSVVYSAGACVSSRTGALVVCKRPLC